MDRPSQFADRLRNFLEASVRLVSESYHNTIEDGWSEDEATSALITHGLRGQHPTTRALAKQLKEAKPYSFEIKSVRHQSSSMEPITGADVGVVVHLSINGTTESKRVFLAQIKKATLEKDSLQFEHLHHTSGKGRYGKPLSQAARMLYFTPSAVYWLAVPPILADDRAFFQHYASTTSFGIRSQQRGLATSGSPAVGGSTAASSLLPAVSGVPEFERYSHLFHDYWHYRVHILDHDRRQVEREFKEAIESATTDLLTRHLHANLLNECHRVHGMVNRLPVIVTHAEAVLSLAPEERNDLSALFQTSTSLPEFIMGDVLVDSFGDTNPELIDALTNPKPNDFVRDVASTIRDDDSHGEIYVRTLVELQLDVATHAEEEIEG